MKKIILASILLPALLGSASCTEFLNEGQSPPQPNIVLIIADDMSWDDSQPYGNANVRTPNLTRLAQEGIRFDQAFVAASSCSPSRASIVTGRYPHSTGAEQLHWPLPAEQVTFVEILKESGYWTAAAGKWHLGEAVKNRFDEVREADPAGFQLTTDTGAPSGRLGVAGGGDLQSGADQWLPVLRSRPQNRPFFLWLAALDPHRDYEENIIPVPHRPENVRVPPYLPDVEATRRELALYYDEITRLDSHIGEVLKELERQGILDETFVFFISDNGRPFPRDKTTLYDSGIKTPWIVHWPAWVKGGTSCDSLVSAVDIAPTILELAGLDIPAGIQGRSFIPLLRQPESSIREYVYAEKNWHDYEDRARAVRDVRYKYIRNSYPDLPATPPADVVRSITFQAMQRLRDEGALSSEQMIPFRSPRPPEELYDTQIDPHELRNLAEDPAYSDILIRLREALTQWEERTADARLPFQTPDEFDRETGKPLPNRVRPRPSKKMMLEARQH